MDSVKMKFALALWLSLVVATAEPVFAQSSNAPVSLSATVDGVRGRCGLGLLARTTSSQTCQSFKDYGSRMQCAADDLSSEARVKELPVLGEVANCYRALGNALVAGRGANNDQVNALEDICRNLRHETVVPRSSVARDALVLASDSLMPGFSRKTVAVPTSDPMMGIRLHDLPDCALALALPPGPASVASAGPSGFNRTLSGAVTGSVQEPRFAYMVPSGVELFTAPPSSVPAPQSASQPPPQAVASSPTESLSPSGTAMPAEGVVDRTVGKTKSRVPGSEMSSAAQISESAVINALPSVPAGSRKSSRRPIARVERNQSGYPVKTVDRGQTSSRSGRGVSDASDSQSGSSGSRSGSRSSYSTPSNSAISASSPPSLPLMGPPLKPQTAGSAR